VPDPEKFPSGMKDLGDWLHARGFNFGIVSSNDSGGDSGARNLMIGHWQRN
jgi:hypothetical protein